MASARTYVLVHGAWHGGWCWRRVADRLQQRGHKVFTPTLTGVGDRAHLLARGIGLDTQIADVVNLMKWEDLSDVVLCGHSYGGSVISGVAEKMEHAIGAIAFLDAFVPDNGQSLVDMTIGPNADRIKAAAARGEIAVPPIPAAVFHVNERDRARVDALCTPHPIGCFLEPITLTGARERISTKAYIRASAYPSVSFDAARAKLAVDKSWHIYDIPCGHDVMLDMPDRLTEVLLELI